MHLCYSKSVEKRQIQPNEQRVQGKILMQRCVTVSYGRVRGRARKWRYWEPAIYHEYQLKDGRIVWKLERACGGARRSERLAENDAHEVAKAENIPFLDGIRHGHTIDFDLL
jgi:hypothetical protein